MKILIKNEDDFTIVIKNNKHHDLIEKARKEKSIDYGKYLLFSKNREVLLQAAKEITDHFNLSEYHVSTKDNGTGDFSYVCFIYDIDDNLKNSIGLIISMSAYRHQINYRKFKPQWKTDNGVYSEAYLKTKKEVPNAL